jgi:hypothetical protein
MVKFSKLSTAIIRQETFESFLPRECSVVAKLFHVFVSHFCIVYLIKN